MSSSTKIKCNCTQCNKEIYKHPSAIKKAKHHIYCSLQCARLGHRSKIDNQIVYDLYFNKKMSKYTIGKTLNVSYGVIYNIFQRNNWKFRTRSESGKYSLKKLNLDKNIIENLYIDKKLSSLDVAKKLEISSSAVREYLRKYNISIRSKSEMQIGEKNSNYINGISKKGYPCVFNKNLKEQIRKRDSFTCQNCEMTEEEHLIVRGRILDVHHINYNKENCNEDNLITLCSWCNTRANFNRDYWYSFYTYIIENFSNSEVK